MVDMEISAEDIKEEFGAYAHPLVKPFHRALNTERGRLLETEGLLVDAFESSLKYLTSVLLAQYQADNLANENVDRHIERLSRPSLGIYSALFRELVSLYGKMHHPLGDEFVSFYQADVGDETREHMQALSSTVDYVLPSNARSYKELMDLFVTYRNRKAHGATLGETEYEQRIPQLAACLAALFDGMRFLAERPLLEIKSGHKTSGETQYDVRQWNGLLEPEPRSIATSEELPLGHLHVQADSQEAGESPGPQLVDIFPFWTVLGGERGNKTDIFHLNGAKKTKIEYLSYCSGATATLTSSQPLFKEARESLGTLEDGGAGLPPHMQGFLEVSEDARQHFYAAQGALKEGERAYAIRLLEDAIEDSPGYRDAVELLASIKESSGLLAEAHEVLASYLDMVPDDLDFLLTDARLLQQAGRREEARKTLRRVKDIDPENGEAQALESELDRPVMHGPPDQNGPDGHASVLSPYEFLAEGLLGCEESQQRLFWAKCLSGALVVFLTFAEMGLFFFSGSLIMALTVGAMGLLWGSFLWATFRIRRLLADSRRNFGAFVQPEPGQDPATVYDDLVSPVLGEFPAAGQGWSYLREGIGLNTGRLAVVLVGAIGMSVWFFSVTVYPIAGPLVDAAYFVFCFFLSLSFIYLLSCVITFHRLLKQLRFQRIHFSLVQHPKLSVRYLSLLSRRISYPLLLVYALFTSTLYLGPFLANLALIIALSLFILLVCYAYYSTIFLVRRVILKEKWRRISEFSVHFDRPFRLLVEEARKKHLNRLNDLIEMRDFLDSLNVWADKKSVLLGMSLFYAAVLGLCTIGTSRLMTRRIMPVIADYARKADEGTRTVTYPLPNGSQEISINVTDVDDTVVAVWGDDIESMTDNGLSAENPPGNSTERAGFRRCDWDSGQHGSMNVKVPVEQEKHLLIVAYNKVYHGFLWMGGGKLSYDVKVTHAGESLLHRREFVRINTCEMGYVAHLHLQVEQGRVRVKIAEGIENIESEKLREYIGLLYKGIKAEEDAKPDFPVGGHSNRE